MGRRSARDVSTSDYLERRERVFSGESNDERQLSQLRKELQELGVMGV